MRFAVVWVIVGGASSVRFAEEGDALVRNHQLSRLGGFRSGLLLAVVTALLLSVPATTAEAHKESVVSSLHCKGKIQFYHAGGYTYVNQSDRLLDDADCTQYVLSIGVFDRYSYTWVSTHKYYSSPTGATMVDNRGLDCSNAGFKGASPPPEYSYVAHDWDTHTGCHS